MTTRDMMKAMAWDVHYEYSEPQTKSLSYSAKTIIEKYIHLIVENKYDEFYDKITSIKLAREVTKALYQAGLNPKEHMSYCPKGCESLFYYEGKEDPNAKLRGYTTLPGNRSGKSLYTWDTSALKTDHVVYYNSENNYWTKDVTEEEFIVLYE